MSEQLPPLVSHESLRIITAAAQVGKVSPDVLSFLSASTEYHLLDVVNDAANFRARGKRSRLTVDDINASLELRGAESSLVFSGGVAALRDDGSTEAARTVVGADTKVDLRKVANASLPVCPIEPGFDMHWLAVDGQQPLLPQNPIPSSSAARGKGKGTKRGRAKQAGEAGAADGGSAVRARLSEELTTYLRRCCEAVLSRDEAKRSRALASLRTDPGLQQLLPHLCTFIQTKVTEHLKRQKDPDQLATLLQMLKCLLDNSHFAFLEIYLDRLLPPVMSCLLYRDFARRDGVKDRAEGRSWTASSMRGAGMLSAGPPTKWTHWKVRDYAAGLLRAICDKHGNTYPTLQARASNMFCTQITRSKTPLTTLYGAIMGLACLGPLPVEQTLGSRVDSLTCRISQACAASVAKRDTEGAIEADQCRLALLQAIGLSTVASTVGIFGVRDKSSVRMAPRAGASATATATAMTGNSNGNANSNTNNTNNNNGAAKTAHSASFASSGISSNSGNNRNGSSGSGGGSGGTASGGRASPNPTLRRSRLRQRLDRSLYSPGKPRRASQLVAGVDVASKAVAAGVGVGAAGGAWWGAGGGALAGGEGLSGWNVAVGGEGGGGNAFDEVVFPWYVLGLARDGAREGEWLTSRHGLFV